MPSSVTVLSTADFHSTVWTNKQYIAVGLASKTDVKYIESMGLRAPTLSGADLRRLKQRILGFTTRTDPKVEDTHDVQVISPKVIPFHAVPFVRAINRRLVEKTLLPQLQPKPDDVLWTFSPLTYGLEKYYSKVVYHSVDLLHTLPGVPEEALIRSERQLIQRANHVVASSAGVAEHLSALGAKPLLWENVADVETFSGKTSCERTDEVVFAGNITPTKVDFALLRQIAQRGAKLTLAGPVNIDGVAADRELESLLRHPNVTHVGNLAIESLAELFGTHKVGIIPYNINEYTSGVFPLKVYEYLAAGLSVVSTPIASVQASSPEGVALREPEEFGDAVVEALQEWTTDTGKNNSLLAQGHSWSNRLDQVWSLIEGRQ